MNFWISPRVGRGNLVFGTIAIALLFIGGLYLLTGGLSLLLNLGFKTQWRLIGVEPVAITALRVVADALLAWFVVRRVRDTDHQGWWGLGLIVFPLLLGSIGVWISLLGIVALLFVPGTIGPNRFGPDPRGWHSREQYEEQERRLKSGDI